MNKTEKITFYSINLIYFLILGLLSGSFQAALPAFISIFHTNVKGLSIGFLLQSVFNCVGNVLATFFLKKLNRQLTWSFAIFVLGCFSIYTPLCTNIKIFYIPMCIGGLIGAFVNQIPDVWTVELFEGNHNFYLQTLHFIYSFGNFLSPLVVTPFLSVKNSENENATSYFLYNQKSFLTDELKKNTKEDNLFLPYLIMGSFRISISLIVLLTYFILPYKKKQNEKKIIECQLIEENEKPKSFVICFTILISIIFALANGTFTNFSNYLTTFLIKLDYGFDQKQAAYIMMIYSGANLLGRFLSCLLGYLIVEKVSIFFNFTLISFASISLATFGFQNLTILYSSIFIIGFGYSNTYPLIFSYVEKNIKLTDTISSVLALSSNLFLVGNQFLAGHFLEISPFSFLVYNIVFIVLMVFFFLTLNVIQYAYKTKNTQSVE